MAATTLYAAERVITTQGAGITMDGTHIENPGVCTTVFDPSTVWGGQVSNEISNIFFDYDPTLVSQGNASGDCVPARLFPFVSVAADQSLKLSGGDWLSATTNPPNPMISCNIRIAHSGLAVRKRHPGHRLVQYQSF